MSELCLAGEEEVGGCRPGVRAVAQTLALAPASRFVDTVGRKPAIIGAFLVAAVTITAIPFAPNIVILTVLLSVYGVAAAFMGTAPAASVGDAAGTAGGRPVAIFSMFSDFGAIVGPLVAGLLADTVSYPAAFLLGGLLFVATSLYALRMPAGLPTQPAPEPPAAPVTEPLDR